MKLGKGAGYAAKVVRHSRLSSFGRINCVVVSPFFYRRDGTWVSAHNP